MLRKAELLEAFQRLMNCCYPVWSWELDENFDVISTDCPSAELYRKMFLLPEYKETAKNHLCGNEVPLICTLAAVISWAMVFDAAEMDGKRIHVIGPFFSGYKDEENTREIFRILNLDETEQAQIMVSARKIPMLTSSTMIQYSIMLHYCVHEEKIEAKDIDYCLVKVPHRKIRGQVVTDQFDNSSGYWEVERIICEKVRNGDTTIASLAERATVLAPDNYRAYQKDIKKSRIGLQSLLTLVSRAAVEGGLPRKTAFSIATDYREKIMECKRNRDIQELSAEMMLDYAQRVKRAKETLQCSRKIRLCCEYIDTHPEEKITLDIMAEKSEYTPAHLSRKFRSEIGCTITQYIQNSKIERAKEQLAMTDITVEEISGKLGFGTRSYFSSVFRNLTGETPNEYRKKNKIV